MHVYLNILLFIIKYYFEQMHVSMSLKDMDIKYNAWFSLKDFCIIVCDLSLSVFIDIF